MGSFFWVSYVFMLHNPITYPSIAEISFQGFHLLMIPTLLYVIKKEKIFIHKTSFLLIPSYLRYPFFLTFSSQYLLIYLFTAFFLFLISVIALFMIIFADICFVTIYLRCPNCFVFMLDPIWFSGYSLISFSLIRYTKKGELP